jgi:excisionase family DNA binding protein
MSLAAKKAPNLPMCEPAQTVSGVDMGNHNPASMYREQAAMMGKMFYTVEEAAARLGMKVSWLYERTRRKAIPHRRLGKYVRFTEEDLRAISNAAATGTLQ